MQRENHSRLISWVCFIILLGTSTGTNAQFTSYIDCLVPTGWEGKDAKLVVKPLNQQWTIDTTIVFNRHAIFTVTVSEPSSAYIWIDGNKDDINFLIDAPQINIMFDPQATVQTLFTGSLGSKLWRQQRDSLAQLSELQVELRSKFLESSGATDSLGTVAYEQLADSLKTAHDGIVVKMIEENPLSTASWHLFVGHSFPYATALRLFNKLASFSSYPSYREIESRLANKRLGRKAVDFTLSDLSEKPITLSKLKSDYILIDFSESHLSSCRQRHRKLRKIYESYHSRGLEILTVSLEFDLKSKEAALRQEQLPWPVLIDAMETSEAAKNYAVDRLPDNVLLDAHKTVIGRDMSVQDLETALKKLIMR